MIKLHESQKTVIDKIHFKRYVGPIIRGIQLGQTMEETEKFLTLWTECFYIRKEDFIIVWNENSKNKDDVLVQILFSTEFSSDDKIRSTEISIYNLPLLLDGEDHKMDEKFLKKFYKDYDLEYLMVPFLKNLPKGFNTISDLCRKASEDGYISSTDNNRNFVLSINTSKKEIVLNKILPCPEDIERKLDQEFVKKIYK